ncbi:S41 family peptidase [Shewanella sp. GXUN23E]|uniref:S41 family peptidase n=1 Tax=Shewanella sp. GXUN23E TaxID=3422498 RepID=UPI003D7CB475
MFTRFSAILALLLPMVSACTSQPQTPTINAASQCQQDLNFLPDFLLANDTGAPAHLAQKGQAHFDEALQQALSEAASITQLPQCQPIIKEYLKSWREGHLGLTMLIEPQQDTAAAETSQEPQEQADNLYPRLESLSPLTLLLTLPTFDWRYAEAINDLFINEQQLFRETPFWIIDVRQNGGGSDSSYRPVLKHLLSDEYLVTGVEFLVTPDNIDAQRQICRQMNNDAACIEVISPLVEAMTSAPIGSYVSNNNSDVNSVKRTEDAGFGPEKVVILVDKGCGSSCEQFLLAAKQGMNIKLAGRSSYGALDYSNMRGKRLPSGVFELYYATSRSRRLPHLAVDIAGIAPDIFLPPTDSDTWQDDEVLLIQHWLETGEFLNSL